MEKKSQIIKWIAGFLFVLTWIVLLIISKQSEISLKIPLIVSIILSIVLLGIIFGSMIMKEINKLKKNSNLTQLSPQEIHDLLEKIIYTQENHIKEILPPIKSDNVQNNLIYTCRVKLLYKEYYGDEIYVIINASNPKIPAKILDVRQTSEQKLEREINKISTNPEKEPDVRESEESLDPFGKPIRKTKEIIHQKTEKEEESVA